MCEQKNENVPVCPINFVMVENNWHVDGVKLA